MKDGVLVIDKPVGPSSHSAVALVRRLIHASKVGHLGTLDPAASGVLPLVINGATKHAQRLASDEKVYEFTLYLGISTDSDDETGGVISEQHAAPHLLEGLSALLSRFTGRIMQRPPLFSAKKKCGMRACDMARKGQKVELSPGPVTIDSLEIIGVSWPEVRMRMSCRTGTYVRSLCRDLGEALGPGGHARGIRRLKSGPYIIDEAVPLETLRANPAIWTDHLIPL
ncbi:MAG: tRNA pseudouridine(55) synthase TruB [bacterium]